MAPPQRVDWRCAGIGSATSGRRERDLVTPLPLPPHGSGAHLRAGNLHAHPGALLLMTPRLQPVPSAVLLAAVEERLAGGAAMLDAALTAAQLALQRASAIGPGIH